MASFAGPVLLVQGFWAPAGFCAHGVSGAGAWKVMGNGLSTATRLDVSHMGLARLGTPARYAVDPSRLVQAYSTY